MSNYSRADLDTSNVFDMLSASQAQIPQTTPQPAPPIHFAPPPKRTPQPAEEAKPKMVYFANLDSWWGDLFQVLDYIVMIRENFNHICRDPAAYHREMGFIKDGTAAKTVKTELDKYLTHAPALKDKLVQIIEKFFMVLVQKDPTWSTLPEGVNWDAKVTLQRWSSQCLREVFNLFITYIEAVEDQTSHDLTQSGSLKISYRNRGDAEIDRLMKENRQRGPYPY